MKNEIIKSLLEALEKLNGKTITLKQKGFVENKITIESFKYDLNLDILKIEDKKSEQYVTINLNQINKIDNTNEGKNELR